MPFINENFMLRSDIAKRLYSFVKNLPIIDYHCHLDPKMIWENYRFKNATDLFLRSDHYKWRQMRTLGIDEKFITGDGGDYEKFRAFAEVLPSLIGNPLYHWTHLELKRYFDIDDTLSPATCDTIWRECNGCLGKENFRARELILRSNVEAVCTTDDPADTLEYHKSLCDFEIKVLPTFRPDRIVRIEDGGFISYIKSIGANTYRDVLDFIKRRVEYFRRHGCRLADSSLEYVPFSEGDAEQAFNKRILGERLTKDEIDSYKRAILTACADEYASLGFTMQLHIGALRNNNMRMYEKLGADSGFDSINDVCIAEPLSDLLNSLDVRGSLPKTILYNLNPKDNYVIGTMIGNFQNSKTPSKIQFGTGWWFCDQRDGMESQMRALANLGALSKFVGMTTDSRSFVSYTRHEYFRRILSNLIGEWVENGEYPEDYEMLRKIVTGICYTNAKQYFCF